MSFNHGDGDGVVAMNHHLFAQNCMQLVALTILVYDHIITFGDEVRSVLSIPAPWDHGSSGQVQYFWKKSLSPLNFLFMLNRYIVPPAFAVSILVPVLDPKSCHRISEFQCIVTAIIVAIASAMMVIRVYAIHHRSRVVLGTLVFVWGAQCLLMSYSLSRSFPILAAQEAGTGHCIFFANPQTDDFIYFFVLAVLCFDGIAFSLLFYGLYASVNQGFATSIARLMLRDGSLYFVSVAVIEIVWVFTMKLLPSDLKLIFFWLCVGTTVVLMSRLVLHTRSYASSTSYSSDSTLGPYSREQARSPLSRFWRFLTASHRDFTAFMSSISGAPGELAFAHRRSAGSPTRGWNG